jgi:NADPH:quinone reductase-like Zn-dependent oxidoreductase
MTAKLDRSTTTKPAEGGTMRAIAQDTYGSDPETFLREIDAPRPAIERGEVLVSVAAASVDRGTVHLMTGRPQLMRLMGFGFRRPKALNPGRSFAGTVTEVGAGVTDLQPGDEVYGTADGSFAELVAVKRAKVARKPSNLSFEQAAAVPVSGITALQAVRDQAQVQAGQRVLVIGASGGVGTFLVQLAKGSGAHVTGVGSPSKLDLVRSLGADEVIDYTREDALDGTRTYDVILDTGGNRPLAEVRSALAPNGTLVIVGGENDGRWLGGFARNLKLMALAPFARGQRLRSLASSENADDLDALRGVIEEGDLTPAIDRTYPLSQTAAAIRHLMDGDARGKVVVHV